MTDLLDLYFPRDSQPQPPSEPQEARPLAWASNPDAATPSAKRATSQAGLGRAGEALAKRLLTRVFGTAFEKNRVAEVHGYHVARDVDFTAHHPTRGAIHAEVKAVTVDLPLAHLSQNERRLLEKFTTHGDVTLLCLAVFRLGLDRYAVSDAVAVYLIPWPDWLAVEAELAARADGRFRGRSWRAVADADLLAAYALERRGNRWTVPRGHWCDARS